MRCSLFSCSTSSCVLPRELEVRLLEVEQHHSASEVQHRQSESRHEQQLLDKDRAIQAQAAELQARQARVDQLEAEQTRCAFARLRHGAKEPQQSGASGVWGGLRSRTRCGRTRPRRGDGGGLCRGCACAWCVSGGACRALAAQQQAQQQLAEARSHAADAQRRALQQEEAAGELRKSLQQAEARAQDLQRQLAASGGELAQEKVRPPPLGRRSRQV